MLLCLRPSTLAPHVWLLQSQTLGEHPSQIISSLQSFFFFTSPLNEYSVVIYNSQYHVLVLCNLFWWDLVMWKLCVKWKYEINWYLYLHVAHWHLCKNHLLILRHRKDISVQRGLFCEFVHVKDSSGLYLPMNSLHCNASWILLDSQFDGKRVLHFFMGLLGNFKVSLPFNCLFVTQLTSNFLLKRNNCKIYNTTMGFKTAHGKQ